MKKFLETVAGIYAKLGKRQKITILITLVAVIAFLVGIIIYSAGKDKHAGYAVLFDGLSASNSAAVVSVLEKNQVPYELKNEGTILVPAENVYKQRLEVASAGVLKNDKVGFEIFDKNEFGATDEEQRVKYQRAIEGELAKTIESLAPVSKASVHIAFGKDTLFAREKTPPSASLVLTLRPGQKLKEKQISGIKNLVASAITGMLAENVKIIDQNGVNLGASEEEGGFDSDVLAAQVKYKKDYEQQIEQKITNVLAPILGGFDRVVAKVTADFDFSQENFQSEVFDPNSVARSENSLEEKREGGRPKEVGGVPGAISNIGPVQGIEDDKGRELYSKNQSTINYEISKKITTTKGQFARLLRLSVAVVVDGKYTPKEDGTMDYAPIADEELARIKQLVQNSMGFVADRGDSVSVENLRFSKEIEPPTPVMKITGFIERYILPLVPPAKFIFALALVLVFYRKVVAPFAAKMLEDHTSSDDESKLDRSDMLNFDDEEDSIEKFQQARRKVEEQLGIDSGFSEDELHYDILLEKLRVVTSERSEEVAMLLMSLLKNDAEFNQNQKDG